MLIWYGWLLFAAVNLVDLAVQGRDHTSALIAAILVLLTGVTYVAALRPRILADDDAVTLRNPLRDIRVPWGAVTSVELVREVRVHYREETPGPGTDAPARQRVVRGWALQTSRRSQLRAQRRAGAHAGRANAGGFGAGRLRPAWRPGEPQGPPQRQAAPPYSAAAAVAQLKEQRELARERGAGPGNPTVTWSRAAVAALLIPAALVAAVAIIG